MDDAVAVVIGNLPRHLADAFLDLIGRNDNS